MASPSIEYKKILYDGGEKTHIEPKKREKKMDKQSLEYILKSGVSGGLAGSVAKTMIAPLDRIKILFQTSNPDFKKYSGSFIGLFKAGRNIYRNDGIVGLFQGHSATLLRIFPYAAIKFVAYEQFRAVLIPSDQYETGGRRFLAGSVSGLTSVFFTYPLDLIRVRLAFDTKKNFHLIKDHAHAAPIRKRGRLVETVLKISSENPIHSEDTKMINYIRSKIPERFLSVTNFYRGFAPTILGMIPYAGVSFYTHDLFHDIFRSPYFRELTVQQNYTVKKHYDDNTKNLTSHDIRKPLKAWAQLIAGGLAGMFSQTAAYPFEVIRRRMQVGGAVNDGEFLSVRSTSALIFKENGIKGFFVGLSIGYIKVVPMVACSFYVYERTKNAFGI